MVLMFLVFFGIAVGAADTDGAADTIDTADAVGLADVDGAAECFDTNDGIVVGSHDGIKYSKEVPSILYTCQIY